MSSEVCPFCGKTYKRLKSHLPHCKAATSSKTPEAKDDVKVTQVMSSGWLDTALTKPTKKEKSTQTLSAASSQSKKKKKALLVPTQKPLQNASTSSAAPQRKEKLSEQIKAAMSHIATQSPSSTVSNAKKESLQALREAEKSKRVSTGSLKELTSTSGDLSSGLTRSLRTRITAQTETKDSNDNTHLFADAKPKGGPSRKVSKTKMGQDVSSTPDSLSSLDSKIKQSGVKSYVGDKFLEVSEEDCENLSANKMFLKSGSGHQARITLNDVRGILGRANNTRSSSILSQILCKDNDLSSKIRPGSHLSPVPVPTGRQDVDRLLQSELPSSTSPCTELESVKKSSSKSKQASLVPRQNDASSQTGLASPPVSPLPPTVLLPQVGKVEVPPQTLGMNADLKLGQQMTGLFSATPTLTPVSSHPSPKVRVENQSANEGSVMEKPQLRDGSQNMSASGAKGPMTQQSLGQVRLKDLPEWLICKAPRNPSDAIKMMQRGWLSYYNKYINVKKGGVGGVSMLLVGYCVLSYVWRYPHIKRERWRKYH